MKNFNSLTAHDKSRLLSNLKRTQLMGLAPTAVVVGSVSPLILVDLKSLSPGTLLGALGAFGILFVISMTAVLLALVRQRKLLNSLSQRCGCSSRELLKEARQASKAG